MILGSVTEYGGNDGIAQVDGSFFLFIPGHPVQVESVALLQNGDRTCFYTARYLVV